MLVPPYESRGRVIPVTGTRLVMAIILTTTCARVHEKTPTINTLSLLAEVVSATFNIRVSIIPKILIITKRPTKPKVSPIIAKTESLIDSGR